MSNFDELFLDYSADKLKQYTSRIQDCLGRLTPGQIWTRGNENVNAVGNLVLHLCGNVSQWIGSGVAGRPNTRQRDAEFAARGGLSGTELCDKLAGVVEDAVAILRDTTAQQLNEIASVQNYELSKLEVIYHVVEHFSGHTGQIQFATKLLTGADLGYYKHLSAGAAPPEVPAKTP